MEKVFRGTPLEDLYLTVDDRDGNFSDNPDKIDSDAKLSGDGYAYITFTTAGAGENNHDYDIGLTDNNGGDFRGTFNVEMTHSGKYEINTIERNAWFTQIVGRDFDYSLLLYDENMSEEQNLDRIV